MRIARPPVEGMCGTVPLYGREPRYAKSNFCTLLPSLSVNIFPHFSKTSSSHHRCGIVLCSRDAKFAVECDTFRMSYCLVCLASGTKDPCVRCGHRPSKRVEQLVHLRLKSIYKAFKQSGASLGPSKSGDKDLPRLKTTLMERTRAARLQLLPPSLVLQVWRTFLRQQGWKGRR